MKPEPYIHRKILSRDGIGMTASIRQHKDLFLGRFVTDHPTFILVRRGTKTLSNDAGSLVLRPGDAVALAAGTSCEVRNQTDQGQYEAGWIVCPPALVTEMAQRHPGQARLEGLRALKGLGPEFARAFERAAEAIGAPGQIPDAIAQHRVQELLTWLLQLGFVFKPEPPASLQHRLRLMIGAAPDHPWRSKEIADALAMSEATLRRRLSEEGQSFSAILADVRMGIALTLLQVTDLAIAEIAYQVGYESASRFAVRFRQRFGCSPTAIRGEPRIPA